MFSGKFNHNLDAKGRLTVPASIREQCPEGLIVTKGFDGNLLAYHKPDFQPIVDSLNQISLTDSKGQDLKRHLLSNTDELDFDTAGRVLISPLLREEVMLESEATILGMGGNFEIWPKQVWDERYAKNKQAERDRDRWAAYNISPRGQS